jgi:hypothetical protein
MRTGKRPYARWPIALNERFGLTTRRTCRMLKGLVADKASIATHAGIELSRQDRWFDETQAGGHRALHPLRGMPGLAAGSENPTLHEVSPARG